MAYLSTGAAIAGYRIEAVLGHGSMGTVYSALDTGLDRRVALKVLTPELYRDERFRERFLRESKLAASLEHPHIVPIYAAGEADGSLYLGDRRGRPLAGADARRPRRRRRRPRRGVPAPRGRDAPCRAARSAVRDAERAGAGVLEPHRVPGLPAAGLGLRRPRGALPARQELSARRGSATLSAWPGSPSSPLSPPSVSPWARRTPLARATSPRTAGSRPGSTSTTTPSGAAPEATVAAIAARGVKTLFLETGNSRQPTDVVRPAPARRGSSTRRTRPGCASSPGTCRRSSTRRATCGACSPPCTSRRRPAGTSTRSHSTSRRATCGRSRCGTLGSLALSAALRAAVGDAYPLGAIVPSAVGMERHPKYWPGFPYARAAAVVRRLPADGLLHLPRRRAQR